MTITIATVQGLSHNYSLSNVNFKVLSIVENNSLINTQQYINISMN